MIRIANKTYLNNFTESSHEGFVMVWLRAKVMMRFRTARITIRCYYEYKQSIQNLNYWLQLMLHLNAISIVFL